jgi:hypothetical protein
VSQEFKPSKKSISPKDELVMRVRQMKGLLDQLEQLVESEGKLPHWVVDRLNQAGVLIATAVSYVQFAEQKKFKQPRNP